MKTLIESILLTIILAGFISAANADQLYSTNSIKYSELKVDKVVSGFPLPKADNSVIKDIYKIGPIELTEGQLVDMTSEIRVTNNSGRTIAFAAWAYISEDINEPMFTTHVDPNYGFQKFSKNLYGENVTPKTHR